MLKKDQTDIVKPHEVNDDELLQVHTEEYISSMKVSVYINIMYVRTYVHTYIYSYLFAAIIKYITIDRFICKVWHSSTSFMNYTS